MPGPILWGPNNTANNLQTNLSQSGRFVGAGAALPWTSGTVYVAGDQVNYTGNSFLCLTGNTAGANFEADYALGYWRLISWPIVGKNYVNVGSNFECANVSGWIACKSGTMSLGFPTAVGTANNPFSSSNGGSAATTAQAPAVTSSSPLCGTYSLNFTTSSSGTTAGDMYISQAYTIDQADQAKVLTFKFAYKLVSDTNSLTNFSGTSSNTFGVAIYDLANNAWIQPAGVFNLVQKTGVGYATGTFQTPSNATKFQIAIYNPTATGATTVSLYLDDFYVGPQPFSTGAAMSDWQNYTPTITPSAGFGTVTNSNIQARRVGDTLEVVGSFRCGTVAGGASAQLTLPVSIDLTKLNSGNQTNVLGNWWNATSTPGGAVWNNAGAAKFGVVTSDGSTATAVYFSIESLSNRLYQDAVNAIAANNDSICFKFSFPVSGWSSNTVQSADTATNVVAASYYQSVAQTGSTITLANLVTTFDTNGALSGGSTYVVPVSGYYQLNVLATLSAQSSTYFVLSYTINGGAQVYISNSGYGSQNRQNGSALIGPLKAGDQINVLIISGTSVTTVAGSNNTWVTFNRLSGPAVVQATDSVNALYTTSTTSIANGATQTLAYSVKDYDSTNSFSSNTTYTIPVSGVYSVSGSFFATGTGATPGYRGNFYLQKNATSSFRFIGRMLVDSTGTQYAGTYQCHVKCVAGDTLNVNFTNVGSGVTFTGDGAAADNWIAFARIGN
jgi:hypothetical protein